MKKTTLEEIKQLIRRNPSSIINEDQICLDATFDPDNLSTDEVYYNNFLYICFFYILRYLICLLLNFKKT